MYFVVWFNRVQYYVMSWLPIVSWQTKHDRQVFTELRIHSVWFRFFEFTMEFKITEFSSFSEAAIQGFTLMTYILFQSAEELKVYTSIVYIYDNQQYSTGRWTIRQWWHLFIQPVKQNRLQKLALTYEVIAKITVHYVHIWRSSSSSWTCGTNTIPIWPQITTDIISVT